MTLRSARAPSNNFASSFTPRSILRLVADRLDLAGVC